MAGCELECLFSIFFRTIHSFIHPLAEGPLLFPHFSSLSRGPPWGAGPGFELWPAVQQADALPSELRRTLRSLEMASYWTGAQYCFLDVVRSSDMADCKTKIAGWAF
jgi:hypothetical protein